MPTHFRIHSRWLYTGRFHIEGDNNSSMQDELLGEVMGSPSQKGPNWDDLTVCYALSDSLHSPDFADATIDALLRRMVQDNIAPTDLAKWIYPKTTIDSAHRRLCRDLALNCWVRDKFDCLWKEDFPADFLYNVLADMSAKLTRGVVRQDVAGFLEMKGACEYHEHRRLDLPCYKSSFDNRGDGVS